MLWRIALAAGVGLAAGACGGGQPRTAMAAPSVEGGFPSHSEGVTDRVLPMDVLLSRFREGLPVPTSLEGGARSLPELIERFASAVEGRDTTMLQSLAVSRAEYAWLYFPTSVYATRPYELPPEIAWMLSSAASEKGLARVLRRVGGRPLRFSGYSCAAEDREGDNRFWRACTIEIEHPAGGHSPQRLFGTVVARGGKYKFLSYANDF